MSSPMAQLHKEVYVRTRDYPFFDGMRRGEAAIMSKGSGLGILSKVARIDVTRSASNVGLRGQKKISVELSENDAHYDTRHFPNSVLNTISEPLAQSISARWSATSNINSSALGSLGPDSKVDLHDIDGCSPTSISPSGMDERCYSVTKISTSTPDIPLPLSAALFYRGMEVTGSCQGIHRLNMFLKETKDDVSAGIPSRFLHAVISPDCWDVGSVASTIMYAFYLSETLNDDQLCTVPVINMKRTVLHSHAELRWLLGSCFVDQSSLIFIDEIDLSYYDLYGSRKLVLVNGSKLSANQEALKDAVVEIFNCGEEASCCALIAEKYALTSPEILAGQGFSRLLLAGILVDTGNLANSLTTTKDKYMATLLLIGAGRFGCNGLYQILRCKAPDATVTDAAEVSQKDNEILSILDASAGEVLRKDIEQQQQPPPPSEIPLVESRKGSESLSESDPADVSAEVLPKDRKNLSKLDAAGEVLRKDIKKWSKSGKPRSGMVSYNIGMSSVGIPIRELLSHHSTSAENITSFQQLEKLGLLLIVSGQEELQEGNSNLS